MENNLDYYLIESDQAYQSPSLMRDNDRDDVGLKYLRQGIKVEDNHITYLTFNPPFPKKPDMVDYHFCECRAVFSKKIYDILKTTEIKGLQLVSCIIHSNKGVEYNDYWVANILQEYAFLDTEKSERKGTINENGRWGMVLSMVLNKEEVLKVSLEERLTFVMRECPGYVLYHKTVVDLIMSINPVGIKFIHINDWYNGVRPKQ